MAHGHLFSLLHFFVFLLGLDLVNRGAGTLASRPNTQERLSSWDQVGHLDTHLASASVPDLVCLRGGPLVLV